MTGSVPDFLTNILPLPFNNLFAFFIAFLHFKLSIIDLFLTTTFSNNCGVGIKFFDGFLHRPK